MVQQAPYEQEENIVEKTLCTGEMRLAFAASGKKQLHAFAELTFAGMITCEHP